MTNRLIEVCTNEFERHLERLFETAPRIPGTGMAITPVIGGRFRRWADHAYLFRCDCTGLISGERFRQDEPGWPVLPLHEDAIAAAMDDDDHRLNLLGYYGKSLARMDWSYDAHPPFARYACGLMSYKHTPIGVRADPQLLAEFPPLPLTGLTDGKLHWRSAEQITEDRQQHAWCYEMSARLEEGTVPLQALDEWVREQVPMFVGCC